MVFPAQAMLDDGSEELNSRRYISFSTSSETQDALGNRTRQRTAHFVELAPSPWCELHPQLDHLIEKTLCDSSYEKRTFCFQIKREDWARYLQWENVLRRRCKYPIGYTSANVGCEGDRVGGVYQTYHKELTLINATQKEEEARRSFAYRFFEGRFDESRINSYTFYNLMVRAGFTIEDFEKGQYDYQDRIFVKPIRLEQTILPLCSQEFQKIIDTNLRAIHYPFVTFVFELLLTADYKVQDLPFHYKHNLLATIVAEDERRLYLCFLNDESNVLDLHGMSFKEAFERVKLFIQKKYANYTETCQIITGRGNHIKPGSPPGLLFSSFPQWMKDKKNRLLVKRCIPSDGSYTVLLKKPVECDLMKFNREQSSYEIVRDTLRDMIKTKDLRLRIKVDDTDFCGRLLHFLALKEPGLFQEISPFSIETLPNELRLNLSDTKNFPLINSSINSEIESVEILSTSPLKKLSSMTVPQDTIKKTKSVKKASLKQDTASSSSVEKKENPSLPKKLSDNKTPVFQRVPISKKTKSVKIASTKSKKPVSRKKKSPGSVSPVKTNSKTILN